MQVNGINGGNGLMAAGASLQGQDAVSRSIKQQIAELQKQMQQLSSDNDISAEDKMKKRQELQKEISNLNMELRKHQIEQQNEQRQKAAEKQDNVSEAGEPAGMQSIISADHSVKQAKLQGSVAKQAEGRANVLKVEMKQDGPGKSSEAKKAQAVRLEETAAAAQTAQAGTLAKANRALQDAEKEKEAAQVQKAERSLQKKAAQPEKAEKNRQEEAAQSEKAEKNRQEERTEKSQEDGAEAAGLSAYAHVDIRL